MNPIHHQTTESLAYETINLRKFSISIDAITKKIVVPFIFGFHNVTIISQGDHQK